MAVTAVIPTKGQRPRELGLVVSDLISSGRFDEIIIVKGDGGSFRRWEAAKRAKNSTVYTQDDDCIVGYDKLFKEYDGQKMLVGMERHRYEMYSKSRDKMVGWGALFEKDWINFEPYTKKFGEDDVYRRESDRIITHILKAEATIVDVSSFDTASQQGALCLEPDHERFKSMTQERLKQIG